MDPNEDSDLNSDLNSTSRFNMLLKISFVILLLIAISGLSYIFIFSKPSNKKISITKVTSTLTPSPAKKPNITPVQELQGKIIELNLTTITPVPGSNKIEFSFKLEISEEETKKSQIFFFDKNKLSYIKVTDSSGKIISYKDLKVGQKIKLIKNYALREKLYVDTQIYVMDTLSIDN